MLKFAVVLCGLGMTVAGFVLAWIVAAYIPGYQPAEAFCSGVVIGCGMVTVVVALASSE